MKYKHNTADESEQLSILKKFLKAIPLADSISIPAVFRNPVGGMKCSDFDNMLCTFVGHLLSECIWVPSSSERTEYGKFCFSEPGKRMVNDCDKMTSFIEKFLNFYNKEYV